MASIDQYSLPNGFAQTCWRGLRIAHPSDWEPTRLCDPKEPTECTFADRRYQRLQLHWQNLPRQPDLAEMYKRIATEGKDRPRPSVLKGIRGWRGLIHREGDGHVVHAGTFLGETNCLVQAVMTWPGQRDRRVEQEVLASIGPQPTEGGTLWEAMGLRVNVPAELVLKRCSSKVGRIRWDFRRAGRGVEGLTVERLAMPGDFLSKPLGQWLAGEMGPGFYSLGERAIDCGQAGGSELYSRGGSPLQRVLRRGIRRLDRAWLCRPEDRIYRLAYWRTAAGPIDWPEGLQVGCCGGVTPRRSAARQAVMAGGG